MPPPEAEAKSPITQTELLPLYNWAKGEFAAVEARNKCQDEAIHKLGLQTSTAVATMEALVQEVRADRREREATLVLAIRAGMREEAEDRRAQEENRFGRLSAEISSSIETLKACTERHENELEGLDIAISGKPTREEFDKLVKRTDKELHDTNVKIDGPDGVDARVKKLETAPGRTALKLLAGAGGLVTTAYVVPHIPAVFEWMVSLFRHRGGI
jgi:hypothetical protein